MTRIPLVLAAAAALAGCGMMPKKEPPPRPFIGTKWQVLLELPIQGEQPFLRFGDGRMEGFGGCNRITARFVQDTVGSRFISFGRIEGGTRACDPSSQEAERHVLEVLRGASSYSITADAMRMTGSAGTLRFQADPPDPPPK
jgi:heat shock protein HslJ